MENQIHASESNFRYAGFGIRFGALLIDFVATLPLYGLVVYALAELRSLPFMILAWLLIAAYKPLLEFLKGATFGKMALGLKVINESGGKISITQSIIRYLPWLISDIIRILVLVEFSNLGGLDEVEGFMEYVILLQEKESTLHALSNKVVWLAVLSGIFVFFNQEKQALHDKLAKTYCIYK